MVRRRMAAPKPSPPVHHRATVRPQNTSVPTRTAPPAHNPPPAQPPVGMPPPAQGPGLFGQMAATAGGVAIGSAVGHAVGNMFTGGGREAVAPAPAEMQQSGQQQQQLSNPCEFEWKQFMQCTETQADISLCQSFNEIFKECRARQI